MSLHEELQRIADSASAPHVDHTVWDRGRSLRRRDRLVASAAVLVMVLTIGSLASLVIGPPRSVAPADESVPEGAIPSRIEDVQPDSDLPVETDLDIGRASVAFTSDALGGVPVVIGATDGRPHLLDLQGYDTTFGSTPQLNPDGRRLAWFSESLRTIHIADLTTGRHSTWSDLRGIRPDDALRWAPSGDTLVFSGSGKQGGPTTGTIDVVSRAVRRASDDVPFDSFASPDGSLYAVSAGREQQGATFVREDGGPIIERPFPADVYPDGVIAQPIGWASDSLAVALAHDMSGTIGKGPDLVLFTSPDRPESEWTFRIMTRDLPVNTTVSIAVDLIPEIDGTSAQPLTHDFGEPDWPGQRDISWLIGLGVAGALSVLYGLRRLWRRRTLRRTNIR